MKQRKQKRFVIGLAVITVILIYIFNLFVKECDKECVGYRFRNMDVEPIIVKNELYFPDNTWEFSSKLVHCGNIMTKKNYDKIGKLKFPLEYFYYFLLDDIWVEEDDLKYEHLIVSGDFYNEYSKVSYLENPERIWQIFEEHSSYMLVSKNNVFDKKCLFPEDMIMELEEEFGECEYEVKAFDEMAEAYYIFVNPYFQYEGTNEDLSNESGNTLHIAGSYISTIFEDEKGKLYYCNKDNLIDDEMTQKIKAVLMDANMIQE